MKKQEYILCAAIHFQDGQTYAHQPKNIESGIVICGRRHHNIFSVSNLTNIRETCKMKIQGFLTSLDRFVGREEAYDIAEKAGQIEKSETAKKDTLLSEDLY